MRRIVIAFARVFVAIGLATIGMVLQRDNARAMDGVLVYALTAPNPTPVPTFGSAVAAGDVNGDGRADVIVGAPGQNEAHVFSGANGTLLYSLSAPDPQPDAGFGKAVAAGDVNGDGKADVIVAAQFQNVGGMSSQGRVYVFSGTDGALLRTIDTLNPSPSGFFGSAVATGDVNGDGKADIIVAAPSESVQVYGSTGRVYVFSGADGSSIYTESTAPNTFGQFGTAVAAGDVNGDGKADFAIGAWAGGFIGPEERLETGGTTVQRHWGKATLLLRCEPIVEAVDGHGIQFEIAEKRPHAFEIMTVSVFGLNAQVTFGEQVGREASTGGAEQHWAVSPCAEHGDTGV